MQVDAGACGSGPMMELAICEEGSAHPASGSQGARTEGNKQKEECNASPEGIWTRNSPVESNLVTKKREDLAKDDKAAPQRSSKGDDAKGGTTTDSEVTHIPELTSSPPRQ